MATEPASPRPSLLSRAATFLATGFGSGYSPFAPGTAGSLVGLALYWPLSRLPLAFQLGATAVVFALGVPAATHVARRTGIVDPGIVVVDEIVGMWISLLLLPFRPGTAALAFVLFRVMDMVKPYPANKLEALPGGWGILCDDVMAGVYANLLVRVALRVLP